MPLSLSALAAAFMAAATTKYANSPERWEIQMPLAVPYTLAIIAALSWVTFFGLNVRIPALPCLTTFAV
jgi:hypothetical protein